MPCDGEYLEPFGKELQLSKVYSFLDELDGNMWKKKYLKGYHPNVYGKTQQIDFDKKVAELCGRLQNIDVTRYSLELQIWWRDHKKADKKRIQRELAKKKKQTDIEEALSKLTQYERDLLGLNK